MTLAELCADGEATTEQACSTSTRLERVRDPSEQTDRQLMTRIKDADALMTQMMAAQAADLAELRRRRIREQIEEGMVGPGADEHGWLVPEVAMTLQLSDHHARERIERAVALERYDKVRFVMSMGTLPVWTMQRLVDHLEELALYVRPERLAEVEEQTLVWLVAGSRTVTQLNARMRRLLVRAKADAGVTDDDEVDRRHAERRVSVTCGRDGTSSLFASLPEDDGLAVALALDARARQPVDEHDQRTVAQRQADQLVAMITGGPAAHGLPGDVPGGGTGTAGVAGVQVRLNVTIPADSLVGGDEPGEVPGYGTIPASTVRRLAGAPSVQARPIVYDPSSGRLLGLGQYLPAARWWEGRASRMNWWTDNRPVPGYEHPRLMDDFIRARDATCRAPGCRRPAARCDCDHLVPYPAGQTSVENSCCLCRRHHRLKTHAAGWQVDGDPSGYLTWRTPTGAVAQTTPEDYRTQDEGHGEWPPF